MKTRTQTALSQVDWKESAFQNLLDAIVAIDGNGVVRYLNSAARRLIGQDPASLPGNQAVQMLHFLDPITRSPIELPDPNSLGKHPQNPAIFLTEVLFSPLKGKEITVNAVFTPIQQPSDSVAGMVLCFRDVTEAAELARKERNKQKIEAISAMAGSLAGEFTNWLGAIAGHAAAIMDNLIPRTRAYEEAVKIGGAVNKASGLTKRLVSLAGIGRDRGAADAEPVDLVTVVKKAVQQAQQLFGDANITFRLKDTADLLPVRANRAQLQDCLLNLFRNAVDAMSGGGIITVDFPASHGAPSSRHYVIVRIRDTGHGMEKNVLEHVFDPFYSTKDPTLSIGLGLTIVQNSLDRWGGLIKIRSRPGHGASIRIFLKPAETEPQGTVGPKFNGKPSANILLVDDDETLLEELCVALKAAGHRPYKTNNAEDGLAYFRRHADETDLLVIDLVMPRKDGKSLLADVLQVNPQAKVIMISGFSRDYVRNYMMRGTWGFVQKPVERAHLLSVVQRMLEGER